MSEHTFFISFEEPRGCCIYLPSSLGPEAVEAVHSLRDTWALHIAQRSLLLEVSYGPTYLETIAAFLRECLERAEIPTTQFALSAISHYVQKPPRTDELASTITTLVSLPEQQKSAG